MIMEWVMYTLLGAVMLIVASTNPFNFGKLRPPGPRVWPVIGTLPAMPPKVSHPVKMFQDFTHRYKSKFIYLQLGLRPVYLVQSVVIAQEILKTNDVEFCGRPIHSIMRTQHEELSFDKSILGVSNYTPIVKNIRKVCIGEMFTVAKVNAAIEGRSELLSALIEKLEHEASANTTVNVSELMETMTFLMMTRLLFGDRYKSQDWEIHGIMPEFKNMVTAWERRLSMVNIGDFLPFLKFLDLQRCKSKAQKAYAEIRMVIGKILEEHMHGKTSPEMRDNFLDSLLALKGKEMFSDVQIMGILNEMVAAGKETSALAIEWALIELLRKPHTLAKLQTEVDNVVGKDRCVEESDLVNLPYVRAVINEVFRLHPPIPLMTRSNSSGPATLAGYRIPQNSAIILNVWGMCRDPDLWGQDASEFIPERFLDTSIHYGGTDYQFLPFGSGRRRCLGMNSGVVISQRSVASLIHAFDWSPPPGMKAQDVSNEEIVEVALHPLVPLVAQLKPRSTLELYKQLRASYAKS